jgi:hypothetical protein
MKNRLYRAVVYVLTWLEEPQVMWRLWKMRWFPYRTAEWKGYDEETGEMVLGPWKWNRPMVLRKKRKDVED